MSNVDEQYFEELKDKTIAQQKAKVETYLGLRARGLPIPPDLQNEIGIFFYEINGEISNRLIDFLYVLARDHLTTGAIEDIMYNFVDTEQSSYCNHFLEGYVRNLAERLLNDDMPITNWKHMYRSPDGKIKHIGGDNPHYGA